MKWPTVTLKEVAERIQYGYTASASEEEIGPKFLRITDIVPSQIDWDQVPCCEFEENDFKKFRLRQGDIVIACTGNTTGYAKLLRDEPHAVFASYLVRVVIDPSRAYSGFVERLIESDIYKRFVLSVRGGAAQGNANAQSLTQFSFQLPPPDVQQRIADIFSSYDDLIENNRRRMALLEESARLLYREWFVRLRFPGHEHTRIINGVPEGWDRSAFEHALVLQRRFDLPIQAREDGDVPSYGSTGINGFHSKAKVLGPGVVTGRSGMLGEVHYVAGDFWPLNTARWGKEFKRVTPLFSLFLMREMDLKQYNGGVSVPTLDRKTVHRVEVLIPPKNLLTAFDEFVIPLFEQIGNLTLQNQKLKQARDLLLPKLMSGEIAV